MVQAWYMDDSADDQRLEHHRDPKEFLDLESLQAKTGVLYWKLDADLYEEDVKFQTLKKERGYSFQEWKHLSPTTFPNFEENMKNFFVEHLHTDEEIRYVLDGTCYFDVRDQDDKWIRIEVTKGDFIVLPAGIYHRFTLDKNNYIKALRLFIGEPDWTPHDRPADDMECRQNYLQTFPQNLIGQQLPQNA